MSTGREVPFERLAADDTDGTVDFLIPVCICDKRQQTSDRQGMGWVRENVE